MKIRNSFVSNSSSSSYIVIQNSGIEKHNFNYQDMALPNVELGNVQFGWEPEDYHDLGSKLNFCALQLLDLRNIKESCDDGVYQKEICLNHKYKNAFKPFFELFKEVCQTELHLDISLADKSYLDKVFCYIDHQSSAIENRNLEMFESRESLVDFLLSKDSYIHTDNDNH